MLIDRAIIEVRSGKGGDGRVAFRREKYINKGGPNGGDGGNGGDVVLVAVAGIDTLLDFSGRHHWHAENGGDGSSKQKHGCNGETLEIRVPPGTLIYDHDTGELLGDLATPGAKLLIAKGGRGGFGNEHFKSPTNQAPTTASPGEPGKSFNLRMELKLVADVGLVGKPNAGKSTLLSRITAARPKIADYPFTTLEPNLGIAESSDHRRLVFADIPGLIEGASEGTGLGFEFLRHIERTRVLVHLLEIEPTDNSDPAENYRVIRKELAGYSQLLAEKPQIVALTKLDLLPTEEDRQTALELIERELGVKALAISAVAGRGLTELFEACWKIVEVEKARGGDVLAMSGPGAARGLSEDGGATATVDDGADEGEAGRTEEQSPGGVQG